MTATTLQDSLLTNTNHREFQEFNKELDDLARMSKEDVTYQFSRRAIASEKIKKMSALLEQIMIKNGQPDALRYICSIILRFAKQKGVSTSYLQYIYDFTPDTHKIHYNDSSYSLLHDNKPLEESTVYFNELKSAAQTLKKFNYSKLTSEQIAELTDDGYDISHNFVQTCDHLSIATIDRYRTQDSLSENDRDTAERRNKSLRISIEFPERYEGADYEAWKEFHRLVEHIEENLAAFPERNEDQIALNVKAIKTMILHWSSYGNMKYRRDPYMYVDIIKNKHSEGGTAAARHSERSIATLKDEVGKPIARGITKEQIDSRGLDIMNDYVKLVNYLPYFRQLTIRYSRNFVPWLDRRASKVAPVLSKRR